MRSFGVRLPILAATAWAGIGLSVMGRDLGYSETVYVTPTVATFALPTSCMSPQTPTWCRRHTAFPAICRPLTSYEPVTLASTSYLTTGYQVRRGLFGRLRLVQRPVFASYATTYLPYSITFCQPTTQPLTQRQQVTPPTTSTRPPYSRLSPRSGSLHTRASPAAAIAIRFPAIRRCWPPPTGARSDDVSYVSRPSLDLFRPSVERWLRAGRGAGQQTTRPFLRVSVRRRQKSRQCSICAGWPQKAAAAENRADSPPKTPAPPNENRARPAGQPRPRCSRARSGKPRPRPVQRPGRHEAPHAGRTQR